MAFPVSVKEVAPIWAVDNCPTHWIWYLKRAWHARRGKKKKDEREGKEQQHHMWDVEKGEEGIRFISLTWRREEKILYVYMCYSAIKVPETQEEISGFRRLPFPYLRRVTFPMDVEREILFSSLLVLCILPTCTCAIDFFWRYEEQFLLNV